MAQDAMPVPNAERPRSRVAIESTVDRAKAFRKARRHTVLVRSLRVLLPLSAVAMLVGYGALMQRSVKLSWGNKKVEIEHVEINREALVAHNPRYTGFDKGGSEFEVRAATAEQDLRQKGMVRLKTIDGWIRDAGRQMTTLKSPRGTLDTNTNVLELYERVDVVSQSGMTMQMTRATVHTRQSRIESSEPVVVRMPTGSVRGNAMTIEQKQRKVLFSGGVITHPEPQPKTPGAQPADPAMRGRQAQPGLGRSDAPIEINSQQLLIDDNTKIATFIGKVTARQAEAVLETERLDVAYEGQAQGGATKAGETQPAPAIAAPVTKATPDQSRVRSLVVPGNLVLTRGAERATGSSGEFDTVTDRATLMGPVEISAGQDRGATADRADIDNKADTILLTGNVVVTQQKNVLKGRRLLADRKNATMQLSSPANAGLTKGQISARLYQQESESAQAKKGAPATKIAAAQPTGLPGAGLLGGARSDPSQPIDITADTLDVDDRKKTAIFRGRVKAIQGDYVINTEELQASYTGDAGMTLTQPGNAAAPPPPAPGQPKTGAQLQQVTAPRRVEIIAKDGQKATGSSAVFDTKANVARLSGDVVLTQGTSILRGNCAVLDMASGNMRLVDACGFSQLGHGTAAPAKSSDAPVTPVIQKGRSQMLIVPGELREEQKKAKQTPAVTPGSSTAPSQTPAVKPAPRPARPRPEETGTTPWGN